MAEPSTAQPITPEYALEAPTERSTVAALQRVFGEERGSAVWSAACRSAGIPVGWVRDAHQLRRVAQTLTESGGAAAAVARSVEIRFRTHARLVARGLTSNGEVR